MAKAIIYARFSPRRYQTECQSIDAQIQMCEDYCRVQNHEIMSGDFHFTDSALSGKSFKRPGLWTAIKNLKRGWVLVVYSQSRLARNLYLTEYIFDLVAKRKAFVEIVSEGGRVSTDPMAVCMRQVRGAFDELDRKMIGKRTSDSAKRLQTNNIAVSKIPPYGKKPGPPNEVIKGGAAVLQRTWVDDGGEMLVIDRIIEMRSEGKKLREIARELNEAGVKARGREWSHVAVKRILERNSQSGMKSVAQDRS